MTPSSLKTHFLAFMRFWRLTDPDNTLSLTSIALIVGIVKFALLREFTLVDLTAFMGAMFVYQGKKYLGIKRVAAQETLENLQSKVTEALETAGTALSNAQDAKTQIKTTADKVQIIDNRLGGSKPVLQSGPWNGPR